MALQKIVGTDFSAATRATKGTVSITLSSLTGCLEMNSIGILPRENATAVDGSNIKLKKMRKPTQKLLKKLKRQKRISGRCSIDGLQQGGGNPLSPCFECRKRFCFDHILSGQIKNGMKMGESVRNVCEDCAKLHGYQYMGDVKFEDRNGRLFIR